MARVCHTTGYDLLILTVQKHDTFGKIWVLSALVRYLEHNELVYYKTRIPWSTSSSPRPREGAYPRFMFGPQVLRNTYRDWRTEQ